MNLNEKKLILLCIFGAAFQAHALPLSELSAEQYYKYHDFENLIHLKKIDHQEYTNYATNKVATQLQGKVVPEKSRQQAVKDIEIVYKNFIDARMDQIQQDAIQQYKTEFLNIQTEAGVKQQIHFYESNQGKNILAKQKIRQAAIQNLQKTIPLQVAGQSQLQVMFGQALQGSN